MDFQKTITTSKDLSRALGSEPHSGSALLPFSQEQDFRELYSYFKNKSVAIVGPSPHLIGENRGKDIDEYDIVCKVGHHYRIKNADDYGKRIDVLFNGCFPDCYTVEEYGGHNIKKIICPIKTCIPGIRDVHNRDIYGFYSKLKEYHKDIDFNTIGLFLCDMDHKIGTRALLGSCAVAFLLEMDLEELGIYGFTWFSEGEPCSSDYNKQYRDTNEKISNPHGCPLKPEVTYIKKMIEGSSYKVYATPLVPL